MLFNQKLKFGFGLVLPGVLLLGAGGCASTAAGRSPSESAPAVSAPPAAASGQDLTATQWAIRHAGAPAAAAAPSETLTRAAVNPTAPLHYTVKRGDTLWGLASMFLKNPWEWPEIWYDNPQIANPHRIYPGDVLVLAYGTDGRARIYVSRGGAVRARAVRLEPRLRSAPLAGAIPTIPYSDVSAFLTRPDLLSAGEVDDAPHVLAFTNEHQVAGAGEIAYVRGLDAPAGARFVVMHIGQKIHDPESGRVLGYQGLYTATAVVERAGDPATVLLTDPERETLRGDCLFPDQGRAPLDFEPRPPATQVQGEIISVIDDVDAIGQYDIVAINRGTRAGVGVGTVLAVDQAGRVVADRGIASYDKWGRNDLFAPHVRLPDLRAGTLLVFKAYEDMSYALVVSASQQMQVDDIVRNP